MRRYSSRRNSKQKRIITVIMCSFLLFMTVGYAAFSTNINITAKGNIINNSFSIDSLKNKVVTSGDGLYVDPVEENRYVYRGADPDNYVTFNGEEAGWRIIAIESDGTLKLRKIESIGNFKYDNSSRNTSDMNSSDYCNDYEESGTRGCNVWGSKTTILDASGSNITKMPWKIGGELKNLPNEEAYLNTYLNTTYYDSLSNEAKEMVETHSFNVGLLALDSTQTLETDIEQEKSYTWRGNVALINITDYVRASTDNSCTSVYAGTQGTYPDYFCNSNNYLFKDPIFTISVASANYTSGTGGAYSVWYVGSAGNIVGDRSSINMTSSSHPTYPVLYIKADTSLMGSGTSEDPYVLK